MEFLRRVRRLVGERQLWPERAERLSFGEARPRTVLHWVSAAVVLLVFAGYLATWVGGHKPMLFDPALQNDDARTHLYPFHAFSGNRSIAEDPLAEQMSSMMTPAVHLLYRVLVPLFGLFVAAKIVQALALLLLFYTGWVLYRSRRCGLACAVLLVFVVLHSEWLINRIAGGLQRSFGFPLLALWVAGALARSERVRFVSLVLAAVTYPTAMVIQAAAETLLFLSNGIRLRSPRFRRAFVRLCLVGTACLMLIGIQLVAKRKYGSIHTLEQARANPTFFTRGRLGELPFPDALTVLNKGFFRPFQTVGKGPFPALQQVYRQSGTSGPVLLVAGLLGLILLRLSPRPREALVLLVASVLLYLAARVFAFHLYNPTRYYNFGMPTAALALTVGTVGLIAARRRPRTRAVIRNFVVAAFVLLACCVTGSGINRTNGMTINGARYQRLHQFIEKLPHPTRIATHPRDGDGIPLWAGKPTMIGWETLQPWLVEQWQWLSRRTEQTLQAMYATDLDELLAYCQTHEVTHILVSADRYRGNFRRHAEWIKPFNTFTRRLLARVQLSDLVLAHVPAAAVVFSEGNKHLIEVNKLAQSMGTRR